MRANQKAKLKMTLMRHRTLYSNKSLRIFGYKNAYVRRAHREAVFQIEIGLLNSMEDSNLQRRGGVVRVTNHVPGHKWGGPCEIRLLVTDARSLWRRDTDIVRGIKPGPSNAVQVFYHGDLSHLSSELPGFLRPNSI